MALEFCTCKSGGKNLGKPGCIPSAKNTAYLFIFPWKDSAGNFNGISSGDTLNKAFFEGKLQNPDKSARWQIVPIMRSPEFVRADPNTFAADNIEIIVSQGNKTFTGVYYGEDASPEFKNALDGWSCGDNAYLRVDTEGNINGNGSIDGFLRGHRIAKNTWNTIYKEATISDPQSLTLTFTLDRLENDRNIRMVTADNIESDVDILQGLVSLIDSELEAVSGVVDSVNVKATTLFGDHFEKEPAEGLVENTDWNVYNNSTSSAVVVTGVTVVDSATGEYQLEFAAQVVGNELAVNTTLTSGYESNVVTQVLA